MSTSIKATADYIVTKEILNQTEKFTINDIFKKVKESIECLFDTVEKMRLFVQNKMDSLCELGLISGTEFYYYIKR